MGPCRARREEALLTATDDDLDRSGKAHSSKNNVLTI